MLAILGIVSLSLCLNTVKVNYLYYKANEGYEITFQQKEIR